MMGMPRRMVYINTPCVAVSMVLILIWIFVRMHHPSLSLIPDDDDFKANLVRFHTRLHSPIVKDNRGWLLDPLSLTSAYAISGGAVNCASIHAGEIRPGRLRGNHRHHDCNETLVIWGASTKFRLENKKIPDSGYAEVTFGSDDVVIVASPRGIAHAIMNIDHVRSTFFIGCQDSVITYNASSTDFNVWKDL
ncbi:uncharacterized protein LOC113868120 [Abrus precatorius]|uniref:Uncharacterized protein LOC113868120 n=1 Tax=Abrus precatorius TaxID=3816 RepID=A0A8B8LUQ0_ABRPR|nr:uncharacterized protein LOC113868120 [Abrus precatorius]